MRPLHSLLLLLPLTACASSPRPADGATPRTRALPVPTEHVLDDDAERQNKADRKAWFRERHWAAEGDDWQAIEAANARARLLERNALVGTQAASLQNWIERGSRNQAGRVHVARHAPDGQALYVGSSKAGIWRGSLDGNGWTPLADNLYGGAHWMAVTPGAAPGAPDVLLAATDGGSVHWSEDDGATWLEPSGLPSSASEVRRVAQTSDGSEAVFMVLRSGSGPSSVKLYRSLDGGRSFTDVRTLGSFRGDAFVPRDGGSTIWAVGSNGIVRSDDLGATWTQTGPLPGAGSRAELAASEAGAPRLWLALHGPGGPQLFRSDDAGATWLFRTDLDDYWGSLSASILDVERAAFGGVECRVTGNGGASFQVVNSWGAYYSSPATRLHADIPGIDVALTGSGGEVWYVSTDGGLFRSLNGLQTVENLSLDGLRISQYYTTHTSTTNPDHVVAGAQDQGYQRADVPGPGPLDFEQIISGDYAHAVSGDGSHDYVYSVYPGFVLVQIGEDAPSVTTQPQFPNEDHAWLPPLAADATDKTAFFLCAEDVHRYTKNPGSNTWGHTPWSQTPLADQSGEYLGGLAFSPVDGDRAFAVTSRGDLYVSSDRAVTWSAGSGNGPSGQYFHGTAIAASSLDRETAWVGGSGYSNPAVWRTTDGGVSWQPWSDGLPPTLVYCLVEAPDGSGTLFCGTEQGAYRRDPGGTWYDITGIGAPINTYWSAEAIPSTNTIRFGTYGRGIWDYSLVPGEVCAWQPFGESLGGANTLGLVALNQPFLGSLQAFRTTGGTPLALGILALSTTEAALPLFGGTVLIDVSQFSYRQLLSDGTGSAIGSFPVPDDPTLAGLEVFVQSALLDPSQPQGWALSSGQRGKLCN